jgi:predicted ATP-binding protein involved in virulence
MRLHRLSINSFAAIGNVEIEFGPGLNVLYGPNDLGKSTVLPPSGWACYFPTHQRIAISTSGGRAVTIRLLR